MPKRFKMSRGHSKRDFSRKGARTHVKNVPGTPRTVMRGGIRL